MKFETATNLKQKKLKHMKWYCAAQPVAFYKNGPQIWCICSIILIIAQCCGIWYLVLVLAQEHGKKIVVHRKK
jgi:hypothetical protein